MRKLVLFGTLAGIAIVGWLIMRQGWQDIWAALDEIGWKILLVTAWYFLPAAIDAAAWGLLYPSGHRPSFRYLYWGRWVSMSLNTLLPTAQVGGHVVSARMVIKSGTSDLPAVDHAATVTADVTIGIVAQVLFTLLGFALVYPYAKESIPLTYWAGAGGGALLIALFLLFQRRGFFGKLMALVKKVSSRQQIEKLHLKAEELDQKLLHYYGQKWRVVAAGGVRFLGWVSKSGETYLALSFLGFDITILGAIMMEAIDLAVMKAAFFMPGGIGAREVSILLVGNIMGIPPDMAVAFALVIRAREVLFGVPGLLSWAGWEGKPRF